jgi:glucose 1-dehydrogenase
MRLLDKVALVTGASRGNGRAIAIGFAREGANVAINYRTSESEALSTLEAVAATGRRAIVVQADTSNSSQVDAMVARVIGEFGRIDILVNNAGVLRRTPFLEITEQEWDMILDINLKGYFLVGQAVARGMVKRGGGVIINVSSVNQLRAGRDVTHYGASKGGVGQLTRQMAYELAAHGVRVNAICPGLIETDINRQDLMDPEFRSFRLGRIPLGIIGEPEDLVGIAVYLAGNESRLVTGAHFYVDGGATIG